MEEKGLAEVVHLAKEDEEEACYRIIEAFWSIDYEHSSPLFFHEMDQDDFAQEARIMMLRAVHKYDEGPCRLLCRLLPEVPEESSSGVSAQGTQAAAHPPWVSRSRGKGGTCLALGFGGFVRATSALAWRSGGVFPSSFPLWKGCVFRGCWMVRPLRRWRTISINRSRPSRELTSGARRNSKTILEKDDDKSR